jgi:predicted metal-binding membrane protein
MDLLWVAGLSAFVLLEKITPADVNRLVQPP